MDENKNVATQTEGTEETKTETSKQDQPEEIDLVAENAKLKAEMAKNKLALDKALHNNGELTKQLRAKMTASEQEEEAKRAAEEAQANRIKELEDYKKRSEARERYMSTIGMTADLAKEAADAEVAGDMDALASVYKRHQQTVLKASEAEWLKKRPVPEMSREEAAQKEDPFLAGFKKG